MQSLTYPAIHNGGPTGNPGCITTGIGITIRTPRSSEALHTIVKMNSYDHYSQARELAKLLARDGANAPSEEVLDAMAIGSTGTEIFMLLRVTVKRSLAAPNLSSDTRQLAQTLLAHLENALQ